MRDGPICAVHFVPLVAMTGRQPVDVRGLHDNHPQLQAFSRPNWGGYDRNLNLDGVVVHPGRVNDAARRNNVCAGVSLRRHRVSQACRATDRAREQTNPVDGSRRLCAGCATDFVAHDERLGAVRTGNLRRGTSTCRGLPSRHRIARPSVWRELPIVPTSSFPKFGSMKSATCKTSMPSLGQSSTRFIKRSTALAASITTIAANGSRVRSARDDLSTRHRTWCVLGGANTTQTATARPFLFSAGAWRSRNGRGYY